MDQFNSLIDALNRLRALGAKKLFFKALQENDNSKQQIYVAESPSTLNFAHPSWTFDAEQATPKAPVTFSWVTPEDKSDAPHAKLIFYPNYPEVRLSGLLKGSRLAPSAAMRPTPKAERDQKDERVLLIGVTQTGAILGHLAAPESATATEALSLKRAAVVTEIEVSENGGVKVIERDAEAGPKHPAYGVVIESPDDESDDDYSDDSLFEISSWGADLSFRELINRYDDDELVKPELQRNYVWDKVEASRFIDSILLGLPVPSIFLAKTKEEKLLIIDGYQRLMTVRDYVKGVFTKDGSSFKLSKTEKIHERWRGKLFSELNPDEQRKIRNTTIHAIIFMQQQSKKGDTSLYQIFERINSSGRSLLPQEIRNCVYQGPFNSLLLELNDLHAWRKLWGSDSRDDRMRDAEFILRFFALSSDVIFGHESAPSRISLKKFLNQYMESVKGDEIDSLRSRFHQVASFVYENIGTSAFHNISASGDARNATFSPTVFDAVMIATDRMLQRNEMRSHRDLDRKRMDRLQDDNYQGLLYQETMRTANIKSRVKLMEEALYG
jgi:hypothetical protein